MVCPKLFEQTLLSLAVASNTEVMGYLYKRSAVMEIQESEKEENYKSRIETWNNEKSKPTCE